ncbi:hypothetical protein BLA29_014907 [Euroglyphus maynei]|uniref:Uncharacterized protein n=1 Tax=Euroglyphus maynei TaxID=6958 RepID=A0A1Y3AL17_EURMA|nr:hypothetical protein BLA29_014907 [Euroglyphus maynei]
MIIIHTMKVADYGRQIKNGQAQFFFRFAPTTENTVGTTADFVLRHCTVDIIIIIIVINI